MPTFRVTDDQDDRRLDRVLRQTFTKVPLGAIMKAIRSGDVRVDGRKSDGSNRLAAGSVINVPWTDEDKKETRTPKQKSDKFYEHIKTIYKDESIWVLDKPSNMPSQPDRSGTMSLIEYVWRELKCEQSSFRPALIGRLDRMVSGAVVAALDHKILRILEEMVRSRSITKIYRAVVHGEPPQRGEIALPLFKDASKNQVFVDERGASALTRYKTLRRGDGRSIVEIDLVTGRPHQARVHMASIGCPIFGDKKYGIDDEASRVMLHSSKIVFPDDSSLPSEIAGRIFKADPPKDFQMIL